MLYTLCVCVWIIYIRNYAQLKSQWEYGVGAKIPTSSWPSCQPDENEIPGLRQALTQCHVKHAIQTANQPSSTKTITKKNGDSESPNIVCGEIQFRLGAALVGLAWDDKAVKEGASL